MGLLAVKGEGRREHATKGEESGENESTEANQCSKTETIICFSFPFLLGASLGFLIPSPFTIPFFSHQPPSPEGRNGERNRSTKVAKEGAETSVTYSVYFIFCCSISLPSILIHQHPISHQHGMTLNNKRGRIPYTKQCFNQAE